VTLPPPLIIAIQEKRKLKEIYQTHGFWKVRVCVIERCGFEVITAVQQHDTTEHNVEITKCNVI
jgi:hypothetical protein